MVSYDINYSHFLVVHNNKLALTTSMESIIKHCRFPASQNTHITYNCLLNEVCCDHGCCITSFRRMAQFWYFWVLLLFICLTTIGCMHYFKQLREHRLDRIGRHLNRRRRRQAAQRLYRSANRRSSETDAECPAARGIRADMQQHETSRMQGFPEPNRANVDRTETGEINNFILEQLLVSYRNTHSNTYLSGPPNYNEIEKDPIYMEPPPKYSDACLRLQDNTNMQINIPRTVPVTEPTESPPPPSAVTTNLNANSSCISFSFQGNQGQDRDHRSDT